MRAATVHTPDALAWRALDLMFLTNRICGSYCSHTSRVTLRESLHPRFQVTWRLRQVCALCRQHNSTCEKYIHHICRVSSRVRLVGNLPQRRVPATRAQAPGYGAGLFGLLGLHGAPAPPSFSYTVERRLRTLGNRCSQPASWRRPGFVHCCWKAYLVPIQSKLGLLDTVDLLVLRSTLRPCAGVSASIAVIGDVFLASVLLSVCSTCR